jgi:hypothetical protein
MEVNKKIIWVNGKPKIYNLYAKEWSITEEEIKQMFGDVDNCNIRFFSEREFGF